jgi:hypothetical protein
MSALSDEEITMKWKNSLNNKEDTDLKKKWKQISGYERDTIYKGRIEEFTNVRFPQLKREWVETEVLKLSSTKIISPSPAAAPSPSPSPSPASAPAAPPAPIVGASSSSSTVVTWDEALNILKSSKLDLHIHTTAYSIHGLQWMISALGVLITLPTQQKTAAVRRSSTIVQQPKPRRSIPVQNNSDDIESMISDIGKISMDANTKDLAYKLMNNKANQVVKQLTGSVLTPQEQKLIMKRLTDKGKQFVSTYAK